MASHIYPIPETYRSVTRPITIEMIRHVLKMTGLNPNSFRTKMVGYAEAETVPGSTLNPQQDLTPNRLSTDDKLTLEVKEEDVGNNITPVRYPDQPPVFHDKDLKIMMKPVLSLTKTTISVVVNVPSRVRANNWLMEIKRRIYQLKMTNYHSVKYHYPIPKPYVYFLTKFHEMRENVEPLNESFGEWLNRCMVNRWTIVSNMEGHERMIAIQELQTNIYGWFDFDFEPEKPEKESDNAGGWRIQFDYSFHYQRPDSMVFAYPLVIHNQLLPLDMIDTQKSEHRDTYNGYQGLTGEAYDKIVFQTNKHGMLAPQGIPEPLFDDWHPPAPPKHYIQLARTLITIDPNDKRWAISLDDFSDSFDFRASALRAMLKSSNKLFSVYDSIYHIRLYRWDSYVDGDSLSLTPDLKIVTDFDMSLKQMWHVVIYVLGNPLYLKPGGWDDIGTDCEAYREWLEAVFGSKYVASIKCNLDGTVDRDSIDKVRDSMKEETGTNIEMGFPNAGIKTVGVYSILANETILEKKNAKSNNG